MTPFTLSAAVQAAINTAVNTDPGANNVNYLAAYNAIYNDLVAQNARGNIIAPEVLAWFQQAPLVNGEQWKPTAQGTFIWDYTVAAAFAEGATITNPDLHKASDAIAFNVFSTLKNDKFSFNSNPDGDFSMTKIIAKDAGAGVQVLKDLHPSAGLDNAIWGGTLFARTELKSPSYFADYHITLGIGTRDSKAVLAGLFAGSDGAFFYSNQTAITSVSNILNLDWTAILAATLPSNSSLILPSWLS
jgi:hypothetical protein